MVYWILFGGLIACGVVKLVLGHMEMKKENKIILYISMGLNCFGVVFLALTRAAYGIVLLFLLLIIKGVLILKIEKAKR